MNEPRRRRGLVACTLQGIFIAIALSILACGVGLVAVATGSPITAGAGDAAAQWKHLLGLLIPGYLLAGAAGGALYGAAQRFLDHYLGRVVFAAFLGAIAYGMVGTVGALAFSIYGINLFHSASPAAAWHEVLPTTLGLAVIAGIVGPPAWALQNRVGSR